ncbi:hypothetical protein TGRH88_043770 [Toxoplasma gondii]|uniref:Uncharacterized protein n=1 Tax=Toxoplasma gondii TaxID=5811 RepID=A0A7J6K222_TOXGO|nr:hypothetical protein TGRH88_043770 [Toxoplasma gondii]
MGRKESKNGGNAKGLGVLQTNGIGVNTTWGFVFFVFFSSASAKYLKPACHQSISDPAGGRHDTADLVMIAALQMSKYLTSHSFLELMKTYLGTSGASRSTATSSMPKQS